MPCHAMPVRPMVELPHASTENGGAAWRGVVAAGKAEEEKPAKAPAAASKKGECAARVARHRTDLGHVHACGGVHVAMPHPQQLSWLNAACVWHACRQEEVNAGPAARLSMSHQPQLLALPPAHSLHGAATSSLMQHAGMCAWRMARGATRRV